MLVIVIREIKILISVIRDQSFLWSLKKNAMPCDTMTPKCTLRQRLVLILSCKESILSISTLDRGLRNFGIYSKNDAVLDENVRGCQKELEGPGRRHVQEIQTEI